MKKLLENLIGLISLPIMIINTFGGIIAFVWLIILSEWNLIITGIVGLFASAFILGFAFLPALAIQGIGWLIFKSKAKFLSYPFFIIAALLDILILILWSVLVYAYALENIQSSTPQVVALLWAYGVTVGPVQWMASKEGPAQIGSFILTFFLSLGCLSLTLLKSLGFDYYANVTYISLMSFAFIIMSIINIIGMFEKKN